jgi:Protein of unknown function (DUF3455)
MILRKYSALALATSLTGCTGISMQASQHPIAVPEAIKASANEKFAFALPAKGVQIYECKADTSGKFSWAFVAPEAELLDLHGKRSGKHYGGPTWELDDGSKTVGTVKQRADAPAKGAIPWLLLSAKPSGKTGQFSPVISLQRVNTLGGVAPETACAANNSGAIARIPYTADYYYFVNK